MTNFSHSTLKRSPAIHDETKTSAIATLIVNLPTNLFKVDFYFLSQL